MTASATATPPPGLTTERWRAAMAEDVADLLAHLADVASAAAAAPADEEFAAGIVWPATRIYRCPTGSVVEAMQCAGDAGYQEVVVVASDAPDLPAMHLAKLFQALATHPVAAAPAAGRGLIAIGARLPVPAWLVEANPSLDSSSIEGLRQAAPSARQVAGTPGWHRLRMPEDIALLDPGLEGWEATRAALDY